MLNKRTHILFDEQTFDLLTWLSNAQNTSIGELVRKAVRKAYGENVIHDKRLSIVKRILGRKSVKITPLKTNQLIKLGRKFDE